jgi:hypothetical protein
MTTFETARRAHDVELREYRTAWDYWRDLRRHVTRGWTVESTLERPPARDWLHFATFGLADWLRGPERLVTYVRREDLAPQALASQAVAAPLASAVQVAPMPPMPVALAGISLPAPALARVATRAIGAAVAAVDVAAGS